MFAGLLYLAKTTPSVSAPIFAIVWFVALFVAVGLAGSLWLRLNDRTYFFYGAYVSMIGVMSLANHVLGDLLHERMGDSFVDLNNFLHLPYAVFYLLFVSHYFNVRQNSPGWSRFHRYLLKAYGVVLVWLLIDAVTVASTGSEWGLLTVNLVNLLSSLVLAGIATHGDRPGAKEFLFASLPLSLSGLVLVAQFLSGEVHDGGPALMAFRTGFILHTMIFLIALSVRYRELRRQLP